MHCDLIYVYTFHHVLKVLHTLKVYKVYTNPVYIIVYHRLFLLEHSFSLSKFSRRQVLLTERAILCR